LASRRIPRVLAASLSAVEANASAAKSVRICMDASGSERPLTTFSEFEPEPDARA